MNGRLGKGACGVHNMIVPAGHCAHAWQHPCTNPTQKAAASHPLCVLHCIVSRASSWVRSTMDGGVVSAGLHCQGSVGGTSVDALCTVVVPYGPQVAAFLNDQPAKYFLLVACLATAISCCAYCIGDPCAPIHSALTPPIPLFNAAIACSGVHGAHTAQRRGRGTGDADRCASLALHSLGFSNQSTFTKQSSRLLCRYLSVVVNESAVR